MKGIRDIVQSFDTKHERGFTEGEVDTLLEQHPITTKEKFYNAMRRATCLFIDGDMIYFRHDVEIALLSDPDNNDWD